MGIAPSEYWKMTPAEVFLIIDANRPKEINGIPEEDFERMLERREELEAQGIKVL